MTLGGRVSEEIFFGKITTGAQDDLQKITRMAFEVCANCAFDKISFDHWTYWADLFRTDGMNSQVGPLSYRQDQESFQKPFSEKTAELLDNEVRKMVQTAHDRTTKLLTEKRADVEKVAKRLLEMEVLSRDDMIDMLGKRPFEKGDVYDDAIAKPGSGNTPAPLERGPLGGQGASEQHPLPLGEGIGDSPPAPEPKGLEPGIAAASSQAESHERREATPVNENSASRQARNDDEERTHHAPIPSPTPATAAASADSHGFDEPRHESRGASTAPRRPRKEFNDRKPRRS